MSLVTDKFRDLQDIKSKKTNISQGWIDEMIEAMPFLDICEGVYGVALDQHSGKWDYRGCCPFPGHFDNTP